MSAAFVMVGIAVIILILVVLGIALYYIKKSIRPVPDRIKLYFDDHFKDIIREWNLVSRAEVKTWLGDIRKRLAVVGKSIERLKSARADLDARLGKLEDAVKVLLR